MRRTWVRAHVECGREKFDAELSLCTVLYDGASALGLVDERPRVIVLIR